MKQRGSVLLVVLALLVASGIAAAGFARLAQGRLLDAQAWQRSEQRRADEDDRHGGHASAARATIDPGVSKAPISEGFHGPQAFSPGREHRVGHGMGR